MKNKKELSIVVAISVILTIMLFSVLGMGTGCGPASPREKARMAECTSKLSQIGKAFYQYAMSYDDVYPTVNKYTNLRTDGGEWLPSGKCYLAFQVIRDSDLLTDPKGYVCPSNKKFPAAKSSTESLSGHVSYQWCDGLIGGNSTLSPVAADGTSNHSGSGRFVRGDGSVGVANSTSRSNDWYKDRIVKDFCKNQGSGLRTLPDQSFE
jgi:hypothetical protein